MPQLLLDPRGITGDLEVRPAPATLPERVREFGYLPDFTLWRPGDLLLFSELERGFISNHIVKAQERSHYAPENARWHHVAIYIGSSDLCEAAPEDGVRCRPVAEYVGNTLIRVRRNENINADNAYGIAIRGAIVKSGVRRVVHAAALLSSMSSIPSLNRTPWMTFASCRNPRSRRQDFSAHRPIL